MSAPQAAGGTPPPDVLVDERVELAGGLSAPRRARGLARELLGPLLGDRRRNDLLVVVTELVTNAVRHAGAGPGERVALHLAATDGVVRVEVRDDGPGFEPVERDPGPDGGFGLLLLRTLPDRFGIAVEGAPASGSRWTACSYDAASRRAASSMTASRLQNAKRTSVRPASWSS